MEGDTDAETNAWAIAPEPGHWTAKLVWHEPQVMRSRTGASPGEEKRSRVPQCGHDVVAVEGGTLGGMAGPIAKAHCEGDSCRVSPPGRGPNFDTVLERFGSPILPPLAPIGALVALGNRK